MNVICCLSEESIAAKIELESGVIAAREHLEQCTAPNPIHDQLERAIRLAQEWIDDSEHLVSSSLYQVMHHLCQLNSFLREIIEKTARNFGTV